MAFFSECYTPDELKDSYRYWAKQLHPDKGGDKVRFQVMQDEYERACNRIESNRGRQTLPRYFQVNGDYEYHRRKVVYVGIYFNHYYKFVQNFGADILIEQDRIDLIYTKRKML